MFLSVWGGELGVELPDILVVEHGQLEELRLYIDSGELAPPLKLFYVVPAAKKYLKSICFAIKYLHYPTAKVVGVDPNFEDFFDSWNSIVAHSSVGGAGGKNFQMAVPDELLEFHPPIGDAFELAKDFVANCRHAFVCLGAMFGTYSGVTPIPNWRKAGMPGLKELDNLCERLERKAVANLGLMEFLKKLKGARDEYARIKASDLSTSLSKMSSYSLAVAEGAIERGDAIGSISLSHRGLDYFFQSLCVDHGLLTESNEGLIFPSDASKKIGLMTCYLTLVRAGILVRSKITNDQLHRCNNIRNNLISTHSVFGTSSDHARRYSRSVLEVMARIDPEKHRAVLKVSGILKLANLLPLNLLFSESGDISTSFVLVPEVESTS